MAKSDDQWAFLQDVARLIVYAQSIGAKLTGGELWRTEEQQRLYVDSGRSKTMVSRHLDRMAIDFNFFVEGSTAPIWGPHPLVDRLGRYWESLGPKNRWGGNFDRDWSRADSWHDRPHFERVA